MRVWLPLLLLGHCAVATADVAQRNWRLYESSHFAVYSDVRPREMARTVRALEIFRAAVGSLTGVAAASGQAHPTRLVLFARVRDFRALVPQQDVIGYMTPGLHYNLMVAAKPSRQQVLSSATEVIFHEYVHDLVRSASSFRYPAWYDEGLAQLLSTARLRKKQLTFGQPPSNTRQTLAEVESAMPVTDMLEYAKASQTNTEQRLRFYTKAWLLTHYLLFSQDSAEQNLATPLSAYLQAFNAGQPSSASFFKHFSVSPTVLDDRLEDYRRALASFSLDLDSIRFDPTFRMRPLTRDEADYELGVLHSDGNPALATRLLERIAPQSNWYHRALAGRGVLAQRQNQTAQGLALLQQAAANHSDDATLAVWLGDGLLRHCRSQSSNRRCMDPVLMNQALGAYQAALAITPNAAAANARYGQGLLHAARSSEAIAPLRKALARVPGS